MSTDTVPKETLVNQPHVNLAVNDLRWKKFPIGTHGFICLVDVMGSDAAIAQAARVSYGAGTSKVHNDEGLIRYLIRHRHTTPLEMCEVKLLVKVPMDTWRQWIRHRTASVNEYSTRYSEAIDERHCIKADEWRLQSQGNRQGSEGELDGNWPEGWYPSKCDNRMTEKEEFIIARPEGDPRSRGVLYPDEPTPGQYLSGEEQLLHEHVQAVYAERLAFGVAREVARKDLPLCTYTQAYWKIDLHNLLHFLGLRMDPHAQQEIREYATTIGEEIVKWLFPVTYQAFLDYKLNATMLTDLDRQVMLRILGEGVPPPVPVEEFMAAQCEAWKDQERCRERDECLAKLQNLGLVVS